MQAEKEKRSYSEDRSERARRRISRAIEGVLCKVSVLQAQVFLSSDPLFLNSTISATGSTDSSYQGNECPTQRAGITSTHICSYPLTPLSQTTV